MDFTLTTPFSPVDTLVMTVVIGFYTGDINLPTVTALVTKVTMLFQSLLQQGLAFD